MADTNQVRSALQREIENLAKARDELRVRMHLAKADALDEWKKLETSWQRVQEEIRRTGEHTKEPVKDMGAAAQRLIDELKRGYARFREQLKETH
jgi:hypothetical protein